MGTTELTINRIDVKKIVFVHRFRQKCLHTNRNATQIVIGLNILLAMTTLFFGNLDKINHG